MKPYFENIAEKIIEELDKANHQIVVAVAWVSNDKIIDTLAKKAREGVEVKVFISKKTFSSRHKEKQYNCIQYLSLCGCQVFKIGDDNDYGRLMHHKFCVIDNHVLITGSFNWSGQASENFEDIIIIDDFDLARQYTDRFQVLNRQVTPERFWFNNLSLKWQNIFKKIIGTDDEPSEDNLREIAALATVDLGTAPYFIRQEWEEHAYNEYLSALDEPTDEELKITRLVAKFEFESVNDLTPLTFLKNLKEINCSGTDIATIEPLQDMVNLEILHICYIENVVLDLKYLKKLTNLNTLNCQGTQLKNYDTLKELNIKNIDIEKK